MWLLKRCLPYIGLLIHTKHVLPIARGAAPAAPGPTSTHYVPEPSYPVQLPKHSIVTLHLLLTSLPASLILYVTHLNCAGDSHQSNSRIHGQVSPGCATPTHHAPLTVTGPPAAVIIASVNPIQATAGHPTCTASLCADEWLCTLIPMQALQACRPVRQPHARVPHSS